MADKNAPLGRVVVVLAGNELALRVLINTAHMLLRPVTKLSPGICGFAKDCRARVCGSRTVSWRQFCACSLTIKECPCHVRIRVVAIEREKQKERMIKGGVTQSERV